ncbi:hypothetical protein E2C01_016214 [Portunus trituberculatus]|uniref:Uncharacterized protein n=1 Tax=Portunus trituberculatus TaxID=210409 RepID=A0A5B7DPP2_PORTR|nr:hypothetical protein [Portunus trituberculatus]
MIYDSSTLTLDEINTIGPRTRWLGRHSGQWTVNSSWCAEETRVSTTQTLSDVVVLPPIRCGLAVGEKQPYCS